MGGEAYLQQIGVWPDDQKSGVGMLARSAADANQEEIGIFCCGAQGVQFGTVGCDLINGSIGCPTVEDGVSLSDTSMNL